MKSLSRFFFISTLLCFASVSFGQNIKTTIKGNIVDESDQPLPGATLMILHAADSVLAQFGSSETDGSFVIRNIPNGDYLLNITFLGLQPVYTPFTAGDVEEKNLGKITMSQSSKLLTEVQVTADYIPIEVTKDTISYNADAFQTQPNAVVEDLLKKLPGIEVAKDGTIKAQGEDVQKVLVDGKEFFGTDPKVATKNLPAKAIKKVKVYDKQSDMAEFTGVDDGQREKTIDLQLKEEFKKGLFGKAEAGYGSDNRYNANAALNRFSKSIQLSFLGQLNNINQQGFSFNDMMNFSGGMRAMGGRSGEFSFSSDIPFNNGTSDGQVITGAGGLNFNWTKNKNFNIRSSYFYNNVDNSIKESIFRQNLSGMPFDTDENADRSTENQSHRITLDSDIRFDSMQQLNLNGRINLGRGNGYNSAILENRLPNGGDFTSKSLSREDNISDSRSINTSATFMQRIGSNGRNASLRATYADNLNEDDSQLEAINQYFITGNDEELNQLHFGNNHSEQWSGELSYTEPLKKRKFLELNYLYSQSESEYDKNVYDIFDQQQIENPALSNAFTSLFSFHRPGATFRYSGQVHNINAGAQYQMSELKGILDEENTNIRKEYYHFLPRIIWRYDIGNGKNMRFSYTTRVNAPTIQQLSPVIDNSDPLRLYVGNPDLNAEYIHNFNLNYHSFTQFTNTSFFISANASIYNNRIITSRSVDDQFVETRTPVNIDGEQRINMYASYGRPFKPIKSRVTVNGNLTLTKSQNLIDSELLDVNRWSRSAGVTISNMNNSVVEYSVGGQWTFTDSYYKVNDALNQNTLLHNYFVDVTLTAWKKWRFNVSYDYNLYTSNEFSDDQSLPLMEASISRYILPNDRGQLVLSFFDVLDENRGLSRSADINYIQEVRSNSIGRYAMLSFVYNLSGGMGGPPPGAIRVIETRR